MFRRLFDRYARSSWTMRGRVNALHEKVDRLAEAVERMHAAQKQDVDRVRERLVDVRNQIRDTNAVLEAAESRTRIDRKQDERWRVIFRRQINSVIRELYLSDVAAPPGADLTRRRFRLRSQNEEDGVVLALMKAGALKTRRFVEIGCGSSGGNSAMLAAELGWSGLMVDASRKAVERARVNFSSNAAVTVIQAFVTAETINGLVTDHGCAGEIDLLSIDIDSIDYWVLEAVAACSPRVLVMEYNALFGPTRAVTIPNTPKPDGAPKGYSGASLAALEKLARRKGYRLVLCEEAGVNAFFLRADVVPDIPGLTAAQAWRPWVDKQDLEGVRLRLISIDDDIARAGLPPVEV